MLCFVPDDASMAEAEEYWEAAEDRDENRPREAVLLSRRQPVPLDDAGTAFRPGGARAFPCA
jgi:hypothetical protein